MSIHFEIHVTDMDSAKAFYTAVLGWQFTPMGAAGGDETAYHLIEADGIGEGQALTGGVLLRTEEPPAPGGAVRGCTLTFEVSDVDAAYEKALASGGAEALPPTDYPGIGRCACCEDGQGNVFGIITPAGDS